MYICFSYSGHTLNISVIKAFTLFSYLQNVRHFDTPPVHSLSSLQYLSHSSIYPSVFLHHLSKHQILLISSTSSPVFKRQIRHLSHPDICMFLSVCPVLSFLLLIPPCFLSTPPRLIFYPSFSAFFPFPPAFLLPSPSLALV